MNESDDLAKKRDEALKALQAIDAAIQAAELAKVEAEMEPLHDLAIHMHDSLCRWNHTDGCSWGYEERGGIHDWSGWAHSRWLSKALEVTKGSGDRLKPVPAATVEALLRHVDAMKKDHPDALWLIRHRLEPT